MCSLKPGDCLELECPSTTAHYSTVWATCVCPKKVYSNYLVFTCCNCVPCFHTLMAIKALLKPVISVQNFGHCCKAFEAASKRSSFGSVVTTRLGAIYQFLESSLGFDFFSQRPVACFRLMEELYVVPLLNCWSLCLFCSEMI